MGLPRAEVARIRTAAAIHDVDKIETPTAILHKDGPLTDEEYEVIKRHPGDGARMVAVLRDAQLTSMVRHHHERLDGSGYPDGLAGEQIPLGARIIAVADTFDAVTSARPYRPASPHRKAIDILKEEAGTRLDPVVVRAFCGHYAGRGPVALWSFVAGLPERVVSWLGASAATVASAAKVAVVTALVGGVAATSTLGLLARHHATKVRSAAAAGRAAQPVHPTAWRDAASALAAAAPAGRRITPVRHVGGGSQALGVPAAAGAGATQPVGLGSAAGGGSGQTESARARESTADANSEQARGVSSREEGVVAVKSRESRGKSEEAHGKREEVAGAGRSEEAQAKAEEAHGKSEEAHTRKEEASTAGKNEEAHAKKEANGGQ